MQNNSESRSSLWIKAQNKLFRQRVQDVLFNTGYPDYALALNAFDEVVPIKKKIGATDYRNLYLNEDLTDDELSIVARHEILHSMLKHHKRRPKKDCDRDLWNEACDYELSHYYSVYDNGVLASSSRLNTGCYVARVPELCGLTASQIYEKLYEIRDLLNQLQNKNKNEKIKIALSQAGSGSGSGSGSGLPTQSQDEADDFDPDDTDSNSNSNASGSNQEQEDDDEIPKSNQSSSSTPNDDEEDEPEEEQGDGSGDNSEDESEDSQDDDEESLAGSGDEQEDEPEEKEKEDESEVDKDVENQDKEDNPEDNPEDNDNQEEANQEEDNDWNDLDGDADEESERLLNERINLAIQAGYSSLSEEQKEQMDGSELLSASGTGKSGIGDKTEPPVIDEAVRLKYQLKSYFIKQEQVEKVKTFKRPAKKYSNSPFIIKGRANKYRESKTLACYVDVSGSMSRNMVKRAMEVVEGLQKIKRLEVKIHYFNTQIHDEFRCGGGTDYPTVLNHATQNKYPCIVVITDASYECWHEQHWEFEAVWLIGIEHATSPYPFEKAVEAPGHPATDMNYNSTPIIKCKKFQYNEVLPVK